MYVVYSRIRRHDEDVRFLAEWVARARDARVAWCSTPDETRLAVLRGLEKVYGHEHHSDDPVPVLQLLSQWSQAMVEAGVVT
jgi:predicted Fe-S protein YdhL (DUF1289 family)